MALLFRAPLLQFDIRDPQQVIRHWPEVLEAIMLSSMDLFERIQYKQPGELSKREEKSVFRYLLRGKYRATPFGKWAGVGEAYWTHSLLGDEKVGELRTSLIHPADKPASVHHYWLNPSLEPWGDDWKFWNFDKEKQHWRYSKSADSLLIRELKHLSYSGQPILKEGLFKSFPGLLNEEQETIWQRLIAQQLLTSGDDDVSSSWTKKEDHYIINKSGLPASHKIKLDNFFSEIGCLAGRKGSIYLERLIDRFEEEFDDRFVPLKMLWKLVPHLIHENEEITKASPNEDTSLYDLSEKRTLNLRDLVFRSDNKKKIAHSQALFRITEKGQILIDNLVFNRPFVYGGRFTHQPELFDYFQRYQDKLENAVYADVILIEDQKVQHISSHRSVTPVTLNCFCGSKHSSVLDTSETYIGIQNGKFILMAPKLGKRVIPIFQHPLNPLFITHPLCRILWEVAHQNYVRPIYYIEPQFVCAEYLPQLEWGDIILQPRQWRVKWQECFLNERDLINHLAAKGIPKQVVVGHQDEELTLDLRYKEDISILIEELRQKKPIHIQEWLWKKDDNFTSDTKSFYPQYLYGQVHKSLVNDVIPKQTVNYISEFESKEWISARLILSPDFQESVIRFQLGLFFDRLEKIGVTPYYFLFYRLKNAEIRVRCRISNPEDKGRVVALLHNLLGKISDIDHIKFAPYYPEHAKYSETAMFLSEEIFYQESKIVLQVNPKSKEEKVMMAVGISSMYFNIETDMEFWIEKLKDLAQGMTSHHPVKGYVSQFEGTVIKGWRVHYQALVDRHPWIRDKTKKWGFVANHIHMLVNRLLWEQGMDAEPEIFSLLGRVLREKKYGRGKLGEP